MSAPWQKVAVCIGAFILKQAKVHPELEPLATSWVNFVNKRGVDACIPLNEEQQSLVEHIAVRRSEYQRMRMQIARQTEEISALEFRIKTLLER